MSRPDEPAPGGFVSLVGAGPGDPDLITLRGVDALRNCDAVLYDELASSELLDLAPPSAQRIAVGRRGHDAPTRGQEEINALLVRLALDGSRVVRLKGGDPFVFGRGGEEASACRAAGVPFEVVPGVSSAIAALAYAGIPITDRRHSASFAVVTGHKDPTRVSEATRWAELGTAVDTLVILMGMRNLPELVAKLIEGGKPPETPAAAVMEGTLARQRVVESTLRDLPDAVSSAGLRAPSVVVVGDVARLRAELAWSVPGPLRGMRVLVTRPRAQAGELARAIRRAGGEAVLEPMIEIAPAEDTVALDRALNEIAAFDGVIFTSANAVRSVAQRARARYDDGWLAGLAGRVLCVGPATARAALDEGIPVTLVGSGRGNAEALLSELKAVFSPAGRRFLFPASAIARDALPEGLRAVGARVDEVVAYRSVRPALDASALCAALVAGELDVLTFASPSAARNFASLLDPPAREAVSRCVTAAIGETTAAALRSEDIVPAVVPETPTAAALVAALIAHMQATDEGARR